MYDIIPLILILASFGTIVFIVLRKSSALASLDVDNMPAEKEARIKDQIISGRLKREIQKRSFWIVKFFRFIGRGLSVFFKNIYEKLHELRIYHKENVGFSKEEAGDLTIKLLNEAEEFIKKDELDEAEKKLIDLLAVDSKNIKAFKKLGDLYYERKDFEDAKQTFEHILKISSEEDGEVYFDLALIYLELNSGQKATDNIKKALQIEPNNPKYLDTMIEIGIINKEKVMAMDAYNRLMEVNPENQKLGELKEEIDKL